MERLRNSRIATILTGLLTVSLGIVVFSPTARADGSVEEYAEWVRLHVPESTEPIVLRAIVLASQHHVRNFEEFVHTFAEELNSLRSIDPVFDPDFPAPGSTDELVKELRFEYTRFVGEAMLHRHGVSVAGDSYDAPILLGGITGLQFAPLASASIDTAAWNDCGNRFSNSSGSFKHSSVQPLGP